MKISLKLIIPTVMAFTLIACGGSGGGSKNNASAEYSGKTTPAEFSNLSSEQAKSVGTTSASVIYEAINFSDSSEFAGMPSAITIEPTINNQASIHRFSQKHISQGFTLSKNQSSPLSNSPIAANQSLKIPCDKGEVVWTSDFNDKNNNMTITMAYKNCRYDEEDGEDGDYSITNGTMLWSMSYIENTDTTTIKAEFKNFTNEEVYNGKKETSKINGYYLITTTGILDKENLDFDTFSYTAKWDLTGNINGKPLAAKGEMSCDSNGCLLTAYIKTEDGKVYKVQSLKITTGSDNEPKTAEGKLYHPDYGHYTFEAKIDWMCDDGDDSPFEGKATLTDESGSVISYASTDCGTLPTIE